MEPLALLCNLYGEGPSTQRRLQSVGLGSLDDLVSIDIETLIERTGWERSEASDFMDQAQALADRLGTGLLEPEAEPAASGPISKTGTPSESTSHPSERTGSEREAERRESVLATWRELDENESELPPVDLLVPQPPPPAEGTLEQGLALLAVDLSEGERVRLDELGVGSIAEFVAASTLELARELELGFTRVRRLQLLASRLGDTLAVPGARSDSASTQGELEPGPGGPFA